MAMNGVRVFTFTPPPQRIRSIYTFATEIELADLHSYCEYTCDLQHRKAHWTRWKTH